MRVEPEERVEEQKYTRPRGHVQVRGHRATCFVMLAKGRLARYERSQSPIYGWMSRGLEACSERKPFTDRQLKKMEFRELSPEPSGDVRRCAYTWVYAASCQ